MQVRPPSSLDHHWDPAHRLAPSAASWEGRVVSPARFGNTMRAEDALALDAFSGGYDPRQPLEEQLRQLWRSLVNHRGGFSWHTSDSRRSDEGWPDESTLVHGRLLFVELKAPRGQPTDKQRETMQLLSDAGQEVYLVTSTGDYGRDAVALAALLDRPVPLRAKRA
jgi:hypothetical protein